MCRPNLVDGSWPSTRTHLPRANVSRLAIELDMEYRIEKDTMGEVKVPADKYWGAQTERSRNNFRIGPPGSMPREIVHAFAYLKKAAALTNLELGKLAEGQERPHRPRVRRDPHRQARRSVPLGDLADRQRHTEQHERERSGGLSCTRAERRFSSGTTRRCSTRTTM
jgi:hypothetical protein